VTVYRTAFGHPGAVVGAQEAVVGATRLWVLPNPSGLNAHWTPTALAGEFARLRTQVTPSSAASPDRPG
jgi:TDG/mug DNA glycosylase family protein